MTDRRDEVKPAADTAAGRRAFFAEARKTLYAEDTAARLRSYGLRQSLPGFGFLLALAETVCRMRIYAGGADESNAAARTAARLGVSESYLTGQIEYAAERALPAQTEEPDRRGAHRRATAAFMAGALAAFVMDKAGKNVFPAV